MKQSNTKDIQYISQEGYDALQNKVSEFEQEYVTLCKELTHGDTLKDMDSFTRQEKRLRLEFLQNEVSRLKYKLQHSRIFEQAPELTETQKIHLGSKVRLQSGDKEL